MTENDKKALEILQALRTADQATRDAWKSQALQALPQDAEFINLVYSMACKG